MKHLVIGHRGEDGSAIFKIIQEAGHQVTGIDIGISSGNCPMHDADFIHICIGDSNKLLITVCKIISEYARSDSIIIIHSTVDIHTTNKIIHLVGITEENR